MAFRVWGHTPGLEIRVVVEAIKAGVVKGGLSLERPLPQADCNMDDPNGILWQEIKSRKLSYCKKYTHMGL